MRRHAEMLVEFFGLHNGIRQMRKWCAWYTTGFRNSAAARAALMRIESLAEIDAIVARLDPDEAFPFQTVRHNRVKDNRTQRVTLPHGYLTMRDDDTPPVAPDDPAERQAFETALDGG
jgi:hypothetical protein